MKKKIVITFLLTAMLAMGMTTVSFAATTDNTETTIEFNKNEAVNVLELMEAPTFSFGSQDLPDSSASFNPNNISDNLVIKDTTGDNAGWNVTAKLSTFSTGEVENSMIGAYLTLKNGTATRNGDGVSAQPEVADSIILTSGSSSTTNIVNADANAGIGTWSISWISQDVLLSVLDTPAAGMNTAEINWVLLAGPAQ